MPEFSDSSDLQINEDIRFQRWEWMFQRVGRVALAAFLLAGILGLLGRGPLSSATATSSDGHARIQYDRFWHFRAPATLEISVDGEAISGSDFGITFDQSYLKQVQIQQITPQPDRVEASSDQHRFVFRVTEPRRPITVLFHLNPDRVGTLHGQVTAEGGETVHFSQFVYP